ncbi:MAG: glycosyltransferase family 4 protein [Paludibacter sp.]|nr:glycosyltransferase family 4 protein [Paludibacter sp.]
MKIAYLFGSLTRGGTETLMLDVFRNATRHGLDAIGIYRKTGEYEQDYLNSGLPMYKLAAGANKFAYLQKLRKLMLVNNIDIIHAQQYIDAFYAYFACLGTKIKIMLTLHGYDFNVNLSSRAIFNFIIKRTDRNIFVSNAQLDFYVSKYKLNTGKQRVVYNGISLSKIINASDKNAIDQLQRNQNIKKELNLSSNTIILTSVGNFLPGRDQMTLCKFAFLLKQRNIKFQLLFVGKQLNFAAERYDACVRYCRDNDLLQHVTFMGMRTDVPQILAQSDAFVYATDHDTFGIAVAEAMATGIPVFVNDWEVMSEITVQGKFATLYKTKDEKDLVEKFMLYLEHKNDYLIKARLAQKFVRETYSIENHILSMMKQYEF